MKLNIFLLFLVCGNVVANDTSNLYELRGKYLDEHAELFSSISYVDTVLARIDECYNIHGDKLEDYEATKILYKKRLSTLESYIKGEMGNSIYAQFKEVDTGYSVKGDPALFTSQACTAFIGTMLHNPAPESVQQALKGRF